MNSKIYRQVDSRWGKLPYKNKSTVGGSGCGLCAVLHCIIERDKYKNYTPKDIHSYMRQFAVDGQGTLWSGIPTALKHYGLTGVKELGTMPELWAEMKKGGRVAVLLMKKGKCKSGRVWTTTAHFVTALDYKYQNKKHYLYFKDSSNRKNDGWIAYETDFINHVKTMWVGTIPAESSKTEPKKTESTDKKSYTGTFPSLKKTVSTNKAELLAKTAESLSWAYGTPKKKWSYKTGAPTSACKTAMKTRGYTSKINMSDCGYFQNTVIYEALGKKVKVLAGTKEKFPSVSGFSIVHKGAVTSKSLKRGDIIRYKSTSGQHVCMYLGGGLIDEAGRGTRFGIVRKSAKYNSGYVKKSTLQVLRVNETKTTKTVSLKKGDSRKEEIKKLQKFLNWYGSYGLTVDGIYGEKTYNAVRKFQLAVGLSGDGMFGSKSLEKAKSVKR